jgi:lipopolysaccharide/colanic/teichoic acid biosynthesis glycosyltransferase
MKAQINYMLKRFFDKLLAGIALLLLSPVLLLIALGIKISSSGSIFYMANRVGLNGKVFKMYKFRTMHVENDYYSAVTAPGDPRIFTLGRWLRDLKIDELPQLVNIIQGDMSIIGPRPEDPGIVDRAYTKDWLRTLEVKPGLSSPGTLYYYTQSEQQLSPGEDVDQHYIDNLLPIRMRLELYYISHHTLINDFKIILHTLWVIVSMGLGKRHFLLPAEYTAIVSKKS